MGLYYFLWNLKRFYSQWAGLGRFKNAGIGNCCFFGDLESEDLTFVWVVASEVLFCWSGSFG